MGIIEQHNIQFKNVKFDGDREKIVEASTPGYIHDGVIYHISRFKNTHIIQEMIEDVEKAIAGDFNLIDDPDVSNNIDVAYITPNGIEFWDEEVQNIIPPLYPLQDFKELLIAWKDFLLTPPYDDYSNI